MRDDHAPKAHVSFFEIDPQMLACLHELRPLIEKVIPTILHQFYSHVDNQPELSKLFGTGALQKVAITHAAAAQHKHWTNLFSGGFDEGYLASIQRIGKVHYQKGVDPRWYIAGYSFIANRLIEAVVHQTAMEIPSSKTEFEKLIQRLKALNKAVMLDVALSLSVYLEENKAEYHKKLDAMTAPSKPSPKNKS